MLLLILLIVWSAYGDISFYNTNNNNTISIIASNSLLLWNYDFSFSNVTVINLQIDQSVFNYCDLEQYTEIGLSNLLVEYYNNITLVNTQWVAFNPIAGMTPCELSIFDLHTAYVLTWDNTLAPYIKRLGAIGFIDTYPVAEIYPLQYIDGCYGKTNILGLDAGDIFGVSILYDDYDDFYSSLNSTPMVLLSISTTHNTQIESYIYPLSFYYYFFRIVNACSFLFCVFTMYYIFRTWKLYTVSQNRRKKTTTTKSKSSSPSRGLNYSGIALIFGFLGTVSRAIIALDPLSTYGIIYNGLNTVSYSLSLTLHTATSFASIIVWLDLIRAVKSSINMRFETIFLTQNIYIRVFFIILIISLVVFDAVNNLLLNNFGINLIPLFILNERSDVFPESLLLFILVLIQFSVALQMFCVRRKLVGNRIAVAAGHDTKYVKLINSATTNTTTTTTMTTTTVPRSNNNTTSLAVSNKIVRIGYLMVLSGTLSTIVIILIYEFENVFMVNLNNDANYKFFALYVWYVYVLQACCLVEIKAIRMCVTPQT